MTTFLIVLIRFKGRPESDAPWCHDQMLHLLLCLETSAPRCRVAVG